MTSRGFYMRISRLGSIIMFAVLFLYLSIRMPDTWLTMDNFRNLVEQTVSLGMCALGMTIVRAAGENDLAIGSTVSLTSMVSFSIVLAGWPVWLSLLATLGVGAGIGLANGLMRTALRIPGIIPTIGSQHIILGLAMICGWGNMIFGRGPGIDELCRLGQGFIGPISVPATILALVVLVVWFVLDRTKLGRMLYAVGGNPEAARLSGTNVNGIVVVAYVLCGMLASAAGFMMSARIGSGNPFAGADLLLDSIIAVMIGSTVIVDEQEFRAAGSVFGAFFITVVMTGMQSQGQGYHTQCLLRAVLLLVSMGLFSMQKRATE